MARKTREALVTPLISVRSARLPAAALLSSDFVSVTIAKLSAFLPLDEPFVGGMVVVTTDISVSRGGFCGLGLAMVVL